jgi:hypothetical protein
VRFDLNYTGGSQETVIAPDMESYISTVDPDGAVESSEVQKVVKDHGATYIENPIDLLAVVYDFDRSVHLARSQDKLTTGRLAAFIPDVINLKRTTA